MRQPVEKDSSAALVRNGKAEPLVLGEDAAFFRGLLNLAPQVEAPLVFLGYGLNVPEKNHDDFAGLNLRGKIAVTMAGRPEGIAGPLAAHAMNASQREHLLPAARASRRCGLGEGQGPRHTSSVGTSRTYARGALVNWSVRRSAGSRARASHNTSVNPRDSPRPGRACAKTSRTIGRGSREESQREGAVDAIRA